MHYEIAPGDIALLRASGLPQEDVGHSVGVARIVATLLEEMPPAALAGLDGALAVRAALFHDLGKTVTTGILHGEEGARIGRGLGLPEGVLAVMVKHVRAGVPAQQAASYGLPPGDRRVTRLEEALAIYADKLSDIVEEPGLAAGLADARRRFAGILSTRADLAKDAATRDRYLALAQAVETAIRQE